MDKEFLKQCLLNGLSTRKIEALPEVTIDHRTISYYIKKYNLEEYMNYKKPVYKEDYFSVIDTKEKAYILGYTLADGYLNDKLIAYCCAMCDNEILDFISAELGGIVRDYNVYNPKTKTFPHSRINIGNSRLVKDLSRLTCGTKENKTFIRIREDLEHYMLLGFFDGDGCLTWGKRKDRNRLWNKVNFTGSYKLLLAVQQLLLKHNISTSLHPKGQEKCYVLEISGRKNVKAILEYMYGNEDLIVLRRKYAKYCALRLEWDKFGGTVNNAIPSQAVDHSTEGVETTGGKMGSLNDQLEHPSLE